MSERDSYPEGVPCWVTNLQRDVPAARTFYEGLFGWETAGGPDDLDPYAIGRLNGRDVAGIGTLPDPGMKARWITEIRVDDLPAAVQRATVAGATVLQDEVDFRPVGRLGLLTDPTGATVTVWEGGQREGAQLVNEPGAWSMSILKTTDVDLAVAFYGEVFGLTSEPMGPLTLLRLPGYLGGEPSQPVSREVVALVAPVDDDGGSRWDVDFWVSDVEAAVRFVAESGGTVHAGPYDAPPAFRQAVVSDPEGAVFTISELQVDRLPG